MHPRIVMHPYRSDLEGNDISDFIDPNGKRLFVEFVKVVKADSAGYVDYEWQWKDDPNRIVPKISYVKGFEPWGWIVGTGIYVEDVRAEIASITRKLTLICPGIIAVIVALSVYKESILAGDGRFNWDIASLNDPFAVCCLMFTIAMVFAGRVQDKLSPRITAVIGGVLTGAGLIVISQSNSFFFWILGFGVLTGLGLGFGYASATPPAIKWFPPPKTGMIAGTVVAGFGLASVYIAPLSNFLIIHIFFIQSIFRSPTDSGRIHSSRFQHP